MLRMRKPLITAASSAKIRSSEKTLWMDRRADGSIAPGNATSSTRIRSARRRDWTRAAVAVSCETFPDRDDDPIARLHTARGCAGCRSGEPAQFGVAGVAQPAARSGGIHSGCAHHAHDEQPHRPLQPSTITRAPRANGCRARSLYSMAISPIPGKRPAISWKGVMGTCRRSGRLSIDSGRTPGA